MDRIDRVYHALRHKEPDKVPKGELQIHDELVQALLQKPIPDWFDAHTQVRKMLNIDLVNSGLEGGPETKLVGTTAEGHSIHRDWLGNEWVETPETRSFLKHALATSEDMESFRMPDISLYRTSNLKRWTEMTDFCVFAQVGGTFDSVYPLMGLTNYMKALCTKPSALRSVVEQVHRFNLEVIRRYAEAGAQVILVGDDIAYDNGPFMSPRQLKEFVFPYMAKEVEEAHRLGLPAVLHSDGNITKQMEEIVGAGFDGLHSLQPSSGVDIVQIKRRWGDRISLMGNLDLDTLLTLGEPAQVESEVRRLIREVAPGGGFILSTTNVLTRYTPAANALAMYRAAEKYGRYPISE